MYNLPKLDRPFRLSVRGLAALAVATLLVVAGCDSNEVADEPEIADVVIFPDSASLAVGEQVDFSAVGLTASGDTVRDADLDLEWWSTDAAVFTVENGGTATGQNPGTAFCKIELRATGANAATRLRAAKRTFDGLDSAFVAVF